MLTGAAIGFLVWFVLAGIITINLMGQNDDPDGRKLFALMFAFVGAGISIGWLCS